MLPQAARASAPREVADEVRSQEKRARVRAVREEASMKAKAAKAREKQEVLWQVRGGSHAVHTRASAEGTRLPIPKARDEPPTVGS